MKTRGIFKVSTETFNPQKYVDGKIKELLTQPLQWKKDRFDALKNSYPDCKFPDLTFTN